MLTYTTHAPQLPPSAPTFVSPRKGRVILGPTVRVLAAPVYYPSESFPIPEDGTALERVGAHAAKKCYRSSGKNGRSNLDNQRAVVESKHGSVLQHLHVSLEIDGITRACSIELNRHDLDISQESTRYVDIEKSGAIVLEPYFASLFRQFVMPEVEGDAILAYDDVDGVVCVDENNAAEVVLAGHVNQQLGAIEDYAQQVKALMELNPLKLSGFDLRKWARGKARNVLPHGLETSGVWTGNYRMWRWVIELRSHRAAEPEVRRLAGAIYDVLQALAPVYFEDATIEMVDGFREVRFLHSKI